MITLPFGIRNMPKSTSATIMAGMMQEMEMFALRKQRSEPMMGAPEERIYRRSDALPIATGIAVMSSGMQRRSL